MATHTVEWVSWHAVDKPTWTSSGPEQTLDWGCGRQTCLISPGTAHTCVCVCGGGGGGGGYLECKESVLY